MWIIDRYVLRSYVKILAVCFLSLTGLYVVIDLFANLDKFLDLAERQGGLFSVLAAFYAPRALTFFDLTSPLMALLAATFVITSLQRSNELAAMMAAGIPRIRVVRSLIVGGLAVSLLAVVSRECLIPQYRQALMRNAQDWEGTKERELQKRYDNQTGICFSGHHTIAAEMRINKPTFVLPAVMGSYGEKLLAQDAYYRAPEGSRPGGYLLDGVQIPQKIAEIPSFYAQGFPILLSPKDTPWLKAEQCFVVSGLTFEHLANGNALRQFSGTRELIATLHNPSLDAGADIRVLIHARLVQPLLDMTLLFLGLPLLISRENRNVFVAVGQCVLVVAVFFLVVLTSHFLGSHILIEPVTAAWGPLLIFIPAARVVAQALWR